ncbi:hypothetical protein AYI69_g6097, partial [Smittium culicis]
MSRNAG